ncbi:hypothetical protein C8F04DRAFT_1263360 [Mycena alexandri]|uniref:CxC2-like cysteine cluster KDZ transposase-associated domain-containing protein n=1 Tax=Mycena alexandri TaxID=1745969 RepID=A0AAD6X115_9AGAR|nr:hypothetical protein C8F04DRAFT_1263360 [Mycena alexandri]
MDGGQKTRAVIFKAIRDSEAERPKYSDIPALCATPQCGRQNPELRCLDCFQAQFICPGCMFTTHQHNPLHQIEWWDNKQFSKTSLQSIGMRIQLGHNGGTCPKPIEHENFRIIDGATVHKVSLDYCGCPGAPSRGAQLLAARLYPQHRDPPQIAVAFQMAYARDSSGTAGSTIARHLQRLT